MGRGRFPPAMGGGRKRCGGAAGVATAPGGARHDRVGPRHQALCDRCCRHAPARRWRGWHARSTRVAGVHSAGHGESARVPRQPARPLRGEAALVVGDQPHHPRGDGAVPHARAPLVAQRPRRLSGWRWPGPPPRGGPWRRAGGKVAGGQRRGRGWPAAPGNGRRHPRGGCQNRGAVRPSVVPSAVAAGVEWAGVHPDKRRRRRVRRRSLRVYPVSHQIRKTENRFNGRGCGRCPRPHTYGTVQY